MSKHQIRANVRWLAAAFSLLALLSCHGTPTGVGGYLVVTVMENNTRPEPGKTIEIEGTLLRATTDANGVAVFSLLPGTYVVRAYDINVGGPVRSYVDQKVTIEPIHTTRVRFNDCTICV